MNNPSPDFSRFKLSIPKALGASFISVVCLQLIASAVNIPSLYWEDFFHLSLPLSFLVGGGLAIFVLIHFVHTSWSSIVDHIWKPSSIALIFLSIILYLLMLPFAELLGSMVPTEGNTFLENLYKNMTETFEMIFDYKIAGFITICILAPIIEEIIFRGIVLRGLLQNGTSPYIAIVLSSLFFGLAHMNPWQFFGAGFLGAIFGFVYYRTKSLWLVMFLHALNNTISFIYMMKYGTMEESVSDPNDFVMVTFLFVGALFVGWTIFKLTENKNKWI